MPDVAHADANSDADLGDIATGDASDGDASNGDISLPDAGPPPLPEQINTRWASFAGRILAGERISIPLTATQGDTIVMWLRQDRESDWGPYLAIHRPGDDLALVFSNPRGADAHIPFNERDLQDGWEFWFGGDYVVVLENRSQRDGWFDFDLRCLDGPCKINSSEPNFAPFEGLSNTALLNAIRSEHHSNGHVELDYRDARRHMFRSIDNVNGEVECVYTGTWVETNDIPDGTYMNTEHTWPQSRGATGTARSDLHHLFPTLTEPNDIRGALFFGNVVSAVDWSQGGSKRGRDAAGQERFDVRAQSQGNIARAIFYFSVIYEFSLRDDEEATLRGWHVADPVDATERARNQAVSEVQNSRNPFVDFPQLVDSIDKF